MGEQITLSAQLTVFMEMAKLLHYGIHMKDVYRCEFNLKKLFPSNNMRILGALKTMIERLHRVDLLIPVTTHVQRERKVVMMRKTSPLRKEVSRGVNTLKSMMCQ